MLQNKNKFIIAGGGTAGWIAALYLKKYFPESLITVIESSQIGILGAGEGTTPRFVGFLNEVDININDFIINTNATIKNGIKFTNWHGDNEYYFHPFSDGKETFWFDENKIFAIDYIANEKDLKNICLSNLCAEQNKIKNYYVDDNFKYFGTFALHFDARMVADYLKRIAVNRGVLHIDSKIISSVHDDNTFNISGLKLENDEIVDCDFLFDCTGFSRKFVGETFKEDWVDYTKSLPVNRALPFFIENKTNIIPPYTEAIAMKYGWIWKIPVQGRYGCGYVFDSSYVTDEEIKKEITDLFGEVTVPRSFSFEAGFYKNIWVKNCICLGLSSGFIEPLEATSIWTTIFSLSTLVKNYSETIFTCNPEEIQSYNKTIREFNEQIKDFIQLHYITKRNDSLFWSEYKTKNLISEKILKFNKVENIHEYEELCNEYFPDFDRFAVYDGVKICKVEVFKKYFDEYIQNTKNSDYAIRSNDFEKKIKMFADFQAVDHYKFLEYVKSLL